MSMGSTAFATPASNERVHFLHPSPYVCTFVMHRDDRHDQHTAVAIVRANHKAYPHVMEATSKGNRN